MKLNIVDKGHSNVMNGADIPSGTVFVGVRGGDIGLFVKYGDRLNRLWIPPSITVISAQEIVDGHVYVAPERINFHDYKVVEELTAVVK